MGGTDYPAWYREHGGAVLATSIDKYCYLSCRKWPPFFDHNYRICYSRIELANHLDEIEHPSVRACLSQVDHDCGFEITHNADLPSRTGLGSSSSFTVGLLHALHGVSGKTVSKDSLAEQAIHIEQNVIGEHVGSQDQVSAAIGGFNLISFDARVDFSVQSMEVSEHRLQELQRHLLLFYSGISRFASEIAGQKIKNIPRNTSQLKQMAAFVPEASNILKSDRDIRDFGRLLHENWQLKKSLSKQVSNDKLDFIYERAMSSGAIGGKVLGAGGGGFVLVFADPEYHPAILDRLHDFLHVPFSFEESGTQTIFCSPNNSYNSSHAFLQSSDKTNCLSDSMSLARTVIQNSVQSQARATRIKSYEH